MAGDFKLAELMRPCRRWKAARTPDVTYQSQQLCWDCANVYGGCDAMYNYKCARCGKKMRSFQPYLELDGGLGNDADRS